MTDYNITKHGIALPTDKPSINYILKSDCEGDFPNQIYIDRGAFFLDLDPAGKIAKLRKKIRRDEKKGFYTDKYDILKKLEENKTDPVLTNRRYVRKLADAWLQGEGLFIGKHWKYRERAREHLTKQISDMVSMVSEDLSGYIDPEIGVSKCPAEGFNYFRNGDGFVFRTTFDLEPSRIQMLNRVYSGQFDPKENEIRCFKSLGGPGDPRTGNLSSYGRLAGSVSENLNFIIYSILTGENLNMVAPVPFNVDSSVFSLKPECREAVGSGVFTAKSRFLKNHEQDEALSSLSAFQKDLASVGVERLFNLAYEMIPSRDSSISHDERIKRINQTLKCMPIRYQSKEFLKHILPTE